MSLRPGNRIAHYEIVEPVGSGGMGDVYRARDTKLGRDVAVKVLPEKLAADAERVARFEREAKVLASLNHPNIASVHGFEESDGVKALVMELVGGETLAERVARGPIPVDEALTIAKQIAEALEAGHAAGIVHRDLKPANVKVKEDGAVKVLDYGLAKALAGDPAGEASAELSQSPTLTRQGTELGVILGTAAYMSPEQAKGKAVDARTDIWAFGCVLYEMLSGRRAFEGEDVSDTLAAVLRAEPDFDALPAETSDSVRSLLRVCTSKQAKQRLQSIGDVRLVLDGVFESEPVIGVVAASARGYSLGVVSAAAVAVGVVTGIVVWGTTRSDETLRPVGRFSISLPDGDVLTTRAGHAMAISPDGRRLVYRANERLYLRVTDELTATPIPGTEGATGSPFFSPDSEWIAFYAEDELRKIAVRGGPPVTLCDATFPYGGHWGEDGSIVFGFRALGIMQVSAEGGDRDVLVAMNPAMEVAGGPQLLPGGEAMLLTHWEGGLSAEPSIWVYSLAAEESKVVIDRGQDARYLPAIRHIVYVSEGTLFAVPFDARALEVKGTPFPVVEDVMMDPDYTGSAHFSVSESGTLVYLFGTHSGVRRLVWQDRNGGEEVLSAEPRSYLSLRLSPDGTRLAVSVADQNRDIWIWDLARETFSRLTFDPAWDGDPVWSPDGSRIAFGSTRAGPMNLFWRAADGSGTVERLTESENIQVPTGFSPDGSRLLFWEAVDPPRFDVGMLTLGGESELIVASPFAELNGEVSPDGRWLAYESNASGQVEVYVRPFPNVEDGLWQISGGGGRRVRWSPQGDALFYVSPEKALMVVRVQTEPGFAPGRTEVVLPGGLYSQVGGNRARTYDVSPDGERFILITDDEAEATEIVVVINWFEELKRLVPAQP